MLQNRFSINSALQLRPVLFPSSAMAIFFASILITLFFWTILPSSYRVNESSDYYDIYEPMARNIIHNGSLTISDKGSGLYYSPGYYPPGYPFLLAALFGSAKILNIPDQVLLDGFLLLSTGVSTVLLFVIARGVWGPMAAAIASLMWATYPFALWLTKQPNSEIPFLVTFYTGFLAFWRALLNQRRTSMMCFVAGFCIGIAMLIRPIAVGMGIVWAATLFMFRSEKKILPRLLMAGMLLLGNALTIAPWQFWVYLQTHKFYLISAHGPSALADGLTFAVSEHGGRPVGGLPEDVMMLMQDIAARGDEMKSPLGVMTVMSSELVKHPIPVVKLFLIKAMRSWYGTFSGRFETGIILLQIPYLLLIFWGSFACWKQGGAAKQLAVTIWVVVFYFWGMTVMVIPTLRYMMPAMGLLFVLVAATFSGTTKRENSVVPGE
jgi:hypothetical protein